jgi:CDGSH-type Zn-finger protein
VKAAVSIEKERAAVKDSEERLEQDEPSIEPRVNRSLRVWNLQDLRDSRGQPIETRPRMGLCRCGHSSDKLFCDGTHREIGFRSDKDPDRTPDRLDDYAGKGIIIHDNRGVCDASGYCYDNLPAVFQPGEEPWIRPDAASPEEIARIIRMCPSGALSYTIGGVLHKSQDRSTAIVVSRDGPYRVVGGIRLNDPTGSRPESEEHYTLCRCGASKNKPFCSGEHRNVGFRDDRH